MTEFVAHIIHIATFWHQMKNIPIGDRVFVHRSRSLLQLSGTTMKTLDGVVLGVISYCTLLHVGQITSFSIGVC